MVLGIDTATPYLSLALVDEAGLSVASFCERVERDHAKRVLPELDMLLKRAGVSKPQLTGVGAGVGPGSYTGLRVGLATAKGLAAALGLPVRGGSTLAAIAAQSLGLGERGAAALDARRGNVYAAVFERTDAGLVMLSEPAKVALDDLRTEQPGLPLFLDEPPDAAYLAQAFLEHGPGELRGLYL